MASSGNRTREQHIAVFGGSGSGKTVLLSSFYGATQQEEYKQDHMFNVVADDTGQGTKLYQIYLQMKNAARTPRANRFSATAYSFSIKLKNWADAKATKNKPFDVLKLVWHDYPGEWFDSSVSGAEESQRRIDGFRSLLSSDVAVLLIDGQGLVDNAGHEERYLKALFNMYSNGLSSLQAGLLKDGKPLAKFPRIWVLALSKSDLLPDVEVAGFRDILIEKAAEDINELRSVLGDFAQVPEAMSVGEDFLLLSSAKFESDKIELDKRVGVELLLPLAAMLPFERHITWAKNIRNGGKVMESLIGHAGSMVAAAEMAATLLNKVKWPGPLGIVQSVLTNALSDGLLRDAVNLAEDQLKKINSDALAKHDYLAATLTKFQMDLNQAEKENIFLRSPK
ncbi:ATP/GTP-binding protein [Cryobacterium sp. TMT1-21]|uniref:TRAFAC clade GTPase domain-containing protein n=1 Tax=Cryobacterium sp. TMT1-21 TaxID=1259234 RepID=UPI001069FB98|nr:ATP/GTP-binding protein [Cryobacterium sp. TMT1-21]TFD16594.1 ATP/GTP-binding protein [Cryobacterium sp. TMT1-21]